MEMPFGKHKGKPISEVPDDYLRWAWREAHIKGALKREIAERLEIRLPSCPVITNSTDAYREWNPPYDGEMPRWPDGFDRSEDDEACPFEVEDCLETEAMELRERIARDAT